MLGLSSEAQIVFNRTEHDFGNISTSQHSFEQDFIFRNTGIAPIKILSVKAVSGVLSFVHTRSEVLSKEYGFVKIKLLTEESDGLFHDEVYITLKQGDELLSEVLYVRANISDDGTTQERQFQDGVISTSVEVSPEDIETMEGFMGDDKLKKAESELVYLKKQVSLKDELISKLSSDLYQQSEEKNENLNRLAELEKTLQTDGASSSEAVAQIQELTTRLMSMKSSDSLLRQEIDSQEDLFARLQTQADSAQQHAVNLSTELKTRFDSEAKAIEKAQDLQADLDAQKDRELLQQAHIDSLQYVLSATQSSSESTQDEIQRLQGELAMKVKEQDMQSDHMNEQQQKIELLKSEKELFANSTDSLNQYLAKSNKSNEELESKLTASSSRLNEYENRLDSLNYLVKITSTQSDSSTTELLALRKKLSEMESADEKLHIQLNDREAELTALQQEKAYLEHSSDSVSSYLSEAAKANEQLQDELKSSSSLVETYANQIDSLSIVASQRGANSDSTVAQLVQLNSVIKSYEKSELALASQLKLREEELTSIQDEKATLEVSSDSISTFLENAAEENADLQEKLMASSSLVKSYATRIDSISNLAVSSRSYTDSSSQALQEMKSKLASIRDQDSKLRDELETKDNQIE